MATANAFHGKPKAFKRAVLANGFHRILAACGRKPARWDDYDYGYYYYAPSADGKSAPQRPQRILR